MIRSRISSATKKKTPSALRVGSSIDPYTEAVIKRGKLTVYDESGDEAIKGGRAYIHRAIINGVEASAKIVTGWTHITGDGTSDIFRTITFPIEFTGEFILVVSGAGSRAVSSGVPNSLTDFDVSSSHFASFEDLTTTTVKIHLNTSSTFSSSYYYGVTWQTIGL